MKLFYGIVLVLMVFVSACAQQPTEPAPVVTPEPTSEPAPEEAETEVVPVEEEVVPEVTINEVRYIGAGGFEPSELTIAAGSAVTWINDDDRTGAVVIFKDGRSYMNSNRILPGEKFEHEFTETGEYEYWWNIAFGAVSAKITVE